MDIDLSEFHEGMLAELREEHGEDYDEHLRELVEADIHESYQQLRGDGTE